jgi:hypothetical protein
MWRRYNKQIVRIISLLAALPLLAGTAFGWGCEGHHMVALIARAHLTPAVSAAVDQLLRDNPIDPAFKMFCTDRPSDLMANTASWADDMKRVDKTFNWHQIDIPLAAAKGDAMQWCDPIGPSVDGKDRPGCIINATEYEVAILRDKSRPSAERAKALRYVIHFMGDLTQPLHNSDNVDQGGNCTSIQFFDEEKPERLHAIWDYRIIARALGTRQGTGPAIFDSTAQARYAATLDRAFAKQWHAWGEGKMDLAAWAWEAHDLAGPAIYQPLKPQIPIEPVTTEPTFRDACNVERAKVEALHVSIGQAYLDQALPVIREQIAKGGYRLAGILNQSFQ